MEKIEIRYGRKKLLLIILFCVFWVIVTSYIMFYTEPYSSYMIVKIITVLINGFIVYVACLQTKLLLENAPVITLSQGSIDFNVNGKLSTFLWGEIKSLTIEQVRAGNRGKTDILTIKSDTEEQKVPLAPLEKNVTEIRALISTYWHKPL